MFAVVLFMVLTIEFGVMLLLMLAPDRWRGGVAEGLLDSTLLTALLAPLLWYTVVRPFQRLSASRGKLLGQMFDAQEQESGRLARDLHDELGQHLAAILIGLRTIEQSATLPQACERAGAAVGAVSQALAEVRRIARGLRPTVLDDLGLVPAVQRVCEEFESLHRVPTELVIDIDPSLRFPAPVELCVYRILQESLTNAARHGGPAQIRVRLEGGKGGVSLTVSDDGRGFFLNEKVGLSFGLNGMRERVETLDGRFEIRSAPGEGTTIRIDLPPEHSPS